jgi:uncharacterized small protein (DUF1192 family)
MNSESFSRMISFRLSVDEYDRCRQLCLERGIASVSEFARSALDLLSHQPSPETLENRVATLEARIEQLRAELESMALGSAISSSTT